MQKVNICSLLVNSSNNLIAETVLSPAIPSDTTELAKYQGETIECASKFEDLMIELGIVASEEADRRLSRFINNIDNHFAIKKQKKILSRARALLLNPEANACLKEVCTSNLLPDVSAFLSFRPSKTRTSSTSKRNAADSDAPSVSGSARSMLESDEDKEEEGLLRIASQAGHLSTKGQDDKETSTFLFNMPKCQVCPTPPPNEIDTILNWQLLGECKHDRPHHTGTPHSRGGLPPA